MAYSYDREDFLKGDEFYWKGNYSISTMLEMQKNGDLTASMKYQVWYLIAQGLSILSIFICLVLQISLYYSSGRNNKYLMHLWSKQFNWIIALIFIILLADIFFTLISFNILSAITRPYYCWQKVNEYIDNDGNFYSSP